MRKNGVDDLLGLSSVGSSGEGVAFQSCDTGLTIAQLGLKLSDQVVLDQLTSSSSFREDGSFDRAAALSVLTSQIVDGGLSVIHRSIISYRRYLSIFTDTLKYSSCSPIQ